MTKICRLIHKLWGNRPWRLVVEAGLAIVLGVGAGRVLVGSDYVVDGASMAPIYPSGMRLYTAPISTPLERGDVVVLDDGKAEYAIKRIIGLPGETVQLWRGHVFINRRMLVEPYLPKKVYTCPTGRECWGATFVLGERDYFVLGDNRPYSTDSRAYGPVDRRQIKRRVPLPENFVFAYFVPYTLPSCGNTLIEPARPNVTGLHASL